MTHPFTCSRWNCCCGGGRVSRAWSGGGAGGGDSDEGYDDRSRDCFDFEKGKVIGSGLWTSEGRPREEGMGWKTYSGGLAMGSRLMMLKGSRLWLLPQESWRTREWCWWFEMGRWECCCFGSQIRLTRTEWSFFFFKVATLRCAPWKIWRYRRHRRGGGSVRFLPIKTHSHAHPNNHSEKESYLVPLLGKYILSCTSFSTSSNLLCRWTYSGICSWSSAMIRRAFAAWSFWTNSNVE